jgi:hypothetical protein
MFRLFERRGNPSARGIEEPFRGRAVHARALHHDGGAHAIAGRRQ